MTPKHNGVVSADLAVPRASFAVDNLRAFVILLVLSFHSVLAYLRFLPSKPLQFDTPPYLWRAIPIIDHQRWFGFDLFCAWQDVFLMPLFFFLSSLFVWPSLARKGIRVFLYHRILRLGVPFALVVALLMPVALYPTYRQVAVDPGLAAYWRHWLALPFWPCGPMWFLWLLLAADFAAAGLHRLAPALGSNLIRVSSAAATRPTKSLVFFLIASALAYVPMALAFGPAAWLSQGPFAFQLSRPLHYALYFSAGMVIGAGGVEHGLLASQGWLARRWAVWLVAALALLLLWMGLTGLTMAGGGSPSLGLQILVNFSFVLACFANCLCVLAIFLRFAPKRLPAFAGLTRSAYGMYLVHYVFVVWLQFALLAALLPAVAKAAMFVAATLLLSWGMVAGLSRVRSVAQIIRAGPAREGPHQLFHVDRPDAADHVGAEIFPGLRGSASAFVSSMLVRRRAPGRGGANDEAKLCL
jgi:glucans biosynthesis protein C